MNPDMPQQAQLSQPTPESPQPMPESFQSLAPEQPQMPEPSPAQPINQFVQPTAGTPTFNSRNIESISFAAQNQNYFTNVKKPREPLLPQVEPDQIIQKHKKEILIGGIFLLALIFVIILITVS